MAALKYLKYQCLAKIGGKKQYNKAIFVSILCDSLDVVFSICTLYYTYIVLSTELYYMI